jgi:NAD(P)-dependent dehydrogenase (short-subunit alcohol dehydrogenase family)
MNVLITGAHSGIGRELVRQYLAEGATVVAADLQSVAALEALPGGTLIPLLLDVADPAAVEAAAAQVSAILPHLDILFNNAGVVGGGDSFEDFDPARFLKIFQVNTAAPITVARAFLPLLKKSTHGRVLTLTSRTAVLFPSKVHAGASYGYAASKAALHRLLPLLAADLAAAGVTSVGISPGLVETDMTRGPAGERQRLAPEVAVTGLRFAAAGLSRAHAGSFVRWDGALCRWLAPAETDADLQRTLPVLPDPYHLAPAP